MNNQHQATPSKKSFIGTAFFIWLLSSFILSLLVFVYLFSRNEAYAAPISLLFLVASFTLSAPAFIILIVIVPVINKTKITVQQKTNRLIWLEFFICSAYGMVTGPVFTIVDESHFENVAVPVSIAVAVACLFVSVLTATYLHINRVSNYFSSARIR